MNFQRREFPGWATPAVWLAAGLLIAGSGRAWGQRILLPHETHPAHTTETAHHENTSQKSAERITFLLSTNAPCHIRVDGESVGELDEGDHFRYRVGLGKHTVEARTVDGDRVWKKTYTLHHAGTIECDIRFARPQPPAPAPVTPAPAPAPDVTELTPQQKQEALAQLQALQRYQEPSSQEAPSNAVAAPAPAAPAPPPAAAPGAQAQNTAAAQNAAFEAAQQKAEERFKAEQARLMRQQQAQLDAARLTGTAILNPKDQEAYIWIAAGSFDMGCVPKDSNCKDDESPEHPVQITRGFWIGRTDVTVGAYRAFATATGRAMPDPPVDPKKQKDGDSNATSFNSDWSLTDHPMVKVGWDDASAFCHWAGGRLPSEAEWEFAARAGKGGQIYSTGSDIDHSAANYGKNSCCGGDTDNRDQWMYTSPVTKFPPNAYGLYDMSGDVWQWVSDYFSDSYYSSSPQIDPQGPAGGSDHVLRGGSWYNGKHDLRLSRRLYPKDNAPPEAIGFRCAVDHIQ